MATVIAGMTASIDGYIANRDDGVGDIFGWYGDGSVTVPTRNPEMSLHVSEGSAPYVRDVYQKIEVVVSGRRLFDITQGWGGRHPLGHSVVVVTHNTPEDWRRIHPDAAFTFVSSVEQAIAQARETAGDGHVWINGASVAQQAIDEGLVDAVAIDMVPVLMGEGIPFFANLANAPIRFEDPKVVEGTGVTHLYYKVRKA